MRAATASGICRWAALALAGLAAAFWILFAVGEVAAGDPSGLQHLAPVAAMALLVPLALRRPPVGAVGLLVVGAAWSLIGRRLLALALLGGPFLLVGLLFGASWLLERRKEAP